MKRERVNKLNNLCMEIVIEVAQEGSPDTVKKLLGELAACGRLRTVSHKKTPETMRRMNEALIPWRRFSGTSTPEFSDNGSPASIPEIFDSDGATSALEYTDSDTSVSRSATSTPGISDDIARAMLLLSQSEWEPIEMPAEVHIKEEPCDFGPLPEGSIGTEFNPIDLDMLDDDFLRMFT